MTRADLITKIASGTGFDKEMIGVILNAFTEITTEELKEGGEVVFRGFGTFENKRRARKKARNLATGAEIMIEPHYTPSFRPSKELNEKVRYSETNKAKIELEEAQIAAGGAKPKRKKSS